MSSSSATTVVSAPGKVLLAGGYLVLERPNEGFVVAADKRFYTTVTSTTSEASNGEDSSTATSTIVIVESPQFHTSWEYTYSMSEGRLIPSTKNPSLNEFVEKSLQVCLLYLQSSTKTFAKLHIVIQADNDFYSLLPHLKDQPKTLENVKALPPFLKCPKDDDGSVQDCRVPREGSLE